MMLTSFTNFAQQYAKAMTDQKTYVTFGGKMAYATANNQINLPALPSGTMLTQWQRQVFTGYLDHEISHLLYTDFSAAIMDRKKKTDPVLFCLWNIFEDIRIENKRIKTHPSTKQYLDACTQEIEFNKRDDDDNSKKTAGWQIFEAIYRHAYEDYRDCGSINFYQKETIHQFPELAKIKREMERLPTLKSERDAEKLAKDVYDLLPKGLDYGKPAATLNDHMEMILIGLGEEDKQGAIQAIKALINGQGKELKNLKEIAEAFIQLTDKSEATKELIEQIKQNNLPHGEQKWGNQILPPVSTAHDRIFEKSEENMISYEQARASASAEILACKKMLNIYLRARTSRAWEKGLPEGKLDQQNLSALFTGNVNLFKRRKDRIMIDTSVQMMVDESGSMSASQSKVAAIIAAEALSGIPNLKLSIAGFTTNEYHYDGKSGGRANGIDVMLYKDFEDTYIKIRARLGTISSRNYTPLGDAFSYGFERMMERSEPRRVLWIVTDGEPCIDVADAAHNEYKVMERIFKRCTNNDIALICTNIGHISDRVRKCCHASFGVDSSRQYPAAVLDVLKEISK